MKIRINNRVSVKIISESDFEISFENVGETYFLTDFGSTILRSSISHDGLETSCDYDSQEEAFLDFKISLMANKYVGGRNTYPVWLEKYLVWSYPKVENSLSKQMPRKKRKIKG